MIINGVSGSLMDKIHFKANEDAQKELKLKSQKEVIQTVQKKKDENREKKEEVKHEEIGTFVMSEIDMKELFLLMGSRGNADSVQKIAELVKKEREMLKNS